MSLLWPPVTRPYQVSPLVRFYSSFHRVLASISAGDQIIHQQNASDWKTSTQTVSDVPGSQCVSFEHELLVFCFSPQHSSEFWWRAYREKPVRGGRMAKTRVHVLMRLKWNYLGHWGLGSDENHSGSQDQEERQSHFPSPKTNQTSIRYNRHAPAVLNTAYWWWPTTGFNVTQYWSKTLHQSSNYRIKVQLLFCF